MLFNQAKTKGGKRGYVTDGRKEEDYLRARQKCRDLLEKKKKECKEKEQIEAKNNKNGKKFRELINSQRNIMTKNI